MKIETLYIIMFSILCIIIKVKYLPDQEVFKNKNK